jgi:hypothetical protein
MGTAHHAGKRPARWCMSYIFLPRQVVECQLPVVAITPAPKPAHGLLASIDHFCKSGGMRLSIRDFAFGIALDGFGFHAINPAQRLAQGQIDDFLLFASDGE